LLVLGVPLKAGVFVAPALGLEEVDLNLALRVFVINFRVRLSIDLDGFLGDEDPSLGLEVLVDTS